MAGPPIINSQKCAINQHEFVNAGGEHTSSVESLWSQVKMWFASMHGVREAHFDHNLCEYMHLYSYCKGGRGFAFECLLKDVAKFYKGVL